MFKKIMIAVLLVWMALRLTGCDILKGQEAYDRYEERPVYDYERWDRL